MQRDKATLAYHGRTQLEWAMQLVTPFVERAFISVRPDQANDPERAKFAQIVDAQDNIGPIAGIMAAQAAHPDTAWLVVACDLPYLDAATLKISSGRGRPTSRPRHILEHDGCEPPALYRALQRQAIIDYVATEELRASSIRSRRLSRNNPRALTTSTPRNMALTSLWPQKRSRTTRAVLRPAA
jgi:molybdopterin-guanine dinucleotide biosynthesis protein A